MNQNLSTVEGHPFTKAVAFYHIDLEKVRLYCTEQASQCVLLYLGLDKGGRGNVAAFQEWLSSWLQETRNTIALATTSEEALRKHLYLFAGAIEALRYVGYWGSLTWAMARSMVGDLETVSTTYTDTYVEGGALILNALFDIQATKESWKPHVATQPASPSHADNLLIEGLPPSQLRSLLQSLTDPMQQIHVLEQLIGMGGGEPATNI